MNDKNTTPNHRRNMLVMKASAGSGKTYNLALQYIKHLLFQTDENGQVKPRRQSDDTRLLNAHRLLLAITFTNKATAEMKDRIVKELYKLSQPGVKSDYLAGFMQLSGLTEARVRDLARQALSELLFDYSNFNVSTIDSFFQSVLRNFARELDRDYGYDIQLEEDYAIRVAVHNFLLSLGKEGQKSQVDQWVKEYQRHLIRGDVEKKRWKFFDDGGELLEFAKQLKTELFRSSMDDIRDYLGECDDTGHCKRPFMSDFSRIRAFKQRMNQLVKQADEALKASLADLHRLLEPYGSQQLLKNTFKTWYQADELKPFSTRILTTIAQGKLDNQFVKSANVDTAVVEEAGNMIKRQFSIQTAVAFLQDIEDNLGLLGMLAMIDVFLERYRHDTNTILIGDTNELIGAVLDSGSDFVYERVGTMISHFMIDEFQDTSTKQYENFKGLLLESIANNNFNMLIGDAKQSIYRFRNADPLVFREKVDNDFRNDIYQPPVQPGEPSSVNYRSSRKIIEFNNALFSFMRERFADNAAVATTYRDVEQGFPANIDTAKVPGYVRVMFGDYSRLLGEPTIAASSLEGGAVDDGGAESDGKANEGQEGDVDVLTVLPGYLLQLHERFGWGRMGILVNSNREGNAVVECILNYNQQTEGEKINIVSGESLLLNNSPIIRRIIAMLRFIDISQFAAAEDDDNDNEEESQPADRQTRALLGQRTSDQRLYAAMDTFIKAVTATEGTDADANGKLLVQSLADQPDAGAAGGMDHAEMLATMLPSGYELTTLVSIVENIIARFKDDPSSWRDVDRETAFLMAFQDEVTAFSSQSGGGSVREFLKYWDEMKGRLAVSSTNQGDAINIMTIHKAKGLEFDCVIIPYGKWYLIDNGQNFERYWMPKADFGDMLKSLPIGDCPVDDSIVPPLVSVFKNHLVKLNELSGLQGNAARFLDKQWTDQMIDNLNKTYVAFTRPCTELHIFAKPTGKAPAEQLVTGLLRDFADNGGLMVPVAEAVDADWREYGVQSSREELEALRPVSQDGTVTEDIGGYRVAPVPPGIKVRLDNASSGRIHAGIRLHSVLSRITDSRDVDRVIADALKHGVITRDADDPCGIDNVNALVREPIMAGKGAVATWFDPANKVYSERTITSAGSSLWDDGGIENLRPDRIVRRPDGQILVIDYKTGDQRRDKKYCGQVQRYIDKLRAIFPGTPIAGRVWYTTLGVIVDERGQALS